MTTKIICPHCEKTNDIEKTFCVSCGGKLAVLNGDAENQLYEEVEHSDEMHEFLTSEPITDTQKSEIEVSRTEVSRTEISGTEIQRTKISGTEISRIKSILGIIGFAMGIILVTLSTWLFWLQDVTFRFYNPSNLTSYFYKAYSIFGIFLVLTIVGLVLSASSKKNKIGFSIAGFVIGTLALAPQILRILAIGYYDVVELLRQLYPAYDYYTWEPWLLAIFIYLIIAFSISARYFKRVLLLFDKRKGKIILQSILWSFVGLISLASAYLIYRIVMHFIDLFF